MPKSVWAGRSSLAGVLLVVAAGLAASWATASEATRPLLQNTLALALHAMLLCLPLGILGAWLAYRTNTPGAGLFRVFLVVLLFVPPYLQVAGWDAGFGLQGWFPRWWLPGRAIAPLEGWRAAVILHAVIALPWVVLLVGLGLRQVPRELEEDALLAGGPLQSWCRVTLPLSAPSIAAAALWCLVLTAGEITITDIYQVRTFAEEIYTGFALGDDLAAARLALCPAAC